MLVFMLTPCFKTLQPIQDYVGLEMVVQIMIEYDCEILMPILLIVYNKLAPTPFNIEFLNVVLPKLGVFGS
jgi:hypothetical protein